MVRLRAHVFRKQHRSQYHGQAAVDGRSSKSDAGNTQRKLTNYAKSFENVHCSVMPECRRLALQCAMTGDSTAVLDCCTER